MSRLIDGDALYEQLKQDEEMAINRVLDTESSLPYSNNLNPVYTRYVAQMNERTRLKHMIADAPTIEERKTEWIPCSERLPEEKDVGRALKKLGIKKRSDYVIATVEVKGKRITATACTYDGAWDWDMKYAYPDYKVIAWMPLPEPYTERREE